MFVLAEVLIDDELEGYIALRLRMNRLFDSRLNSLRPILDEVLVAIESDLKI